MKYCSLCAAPIVHEVPPYDNRPRAVCSSGKCGHIHYRNPLVVTGCIVEHDGRILLCRRAIEPRAGFWTVPAGFLEIGESVRDGALRETLEESGIEAAICALHGIYDIPGAGQMHIIYRARMVGGTAAPTTESTEVQWFARDAIPWDDMAFRVVVRALRSYCNDEVGDVPEQCTIEPRKPL